MRSKVKVRDWPSYSPDLNIMENIWGYLSKDVYIKWPIKNIRNLEIRLNEVVASFNKTQLLQVKSLYKSIMTRLCLILENRKQRLWY